MKLLLSNIIANWGVFQKEAAKIGFEYSKQDISNKTKINEFLNELIENIQLYNDIINIFDYTKQEKTEILNVINKLGLKKTTFLVKLFEKNMKNYYEDESINIQYSENQLFENAQLIAQAKYRKLNENLYFDTNKNPNILK